MNVTATTTKIMKSTESFKIQFMFNAFKIKIDNIIAGRVNKSPNAAIIGLVMLSGSQPFWKLLNDTTIVIGSIIIFEIIPAITQINIKSIKDIEG